MKLKLVTKMLALTETDTYVKCFEQREEKQESQENR